MTDEFENDERPAKPRILFIGWPESSHTHSWIDLLQGADFNVRLFCLPSAAPPASWPVKSYITAPALQWDRSATRKSVFPPPSGSISHLGYLAAEAKGKGVLKGRSGALATRVLNVLDRVPATKHPITIEAALAQVIRAWRPDVIHTLGLDPTSFFYMRARKQFGLEGIGRWILQARGGPDLDLLPYTEDVRKLIVECLTQCDHFICDNENNYENAARLGLDPRKSTEPGLGVVSGSGGIDIDDFRGRWKLLPSQRERVIVWPKAYETYTAKAMPVFEAILKVWDRIQPCRIEMLWMTQPEVRIWYEKFFPAHVKNGCPAHYRLSREETLDHIAKARVMLAPSLSDGIPNTMLEAMALGAAPIVSPIATIVPVVEDEVNVLFARNLYPDDIAGAIVRMMSDDGLVDGMATRNLVRVREMADRGRIRGRVRNYYQQLAELARSTTRKEATR
jgi:glycosyltransferase involved in cell wall biosynthesis